MGVKGLIMKLEFSWQLRFPVGRRINFCKGLTLEFLLGFICPAEKGRKLPLEFLPGLYIISLVVFKIHCSSTPLALQN